MEPTPVLPEAPRNDPMSDTSANRRTNLITALVATVLSLTVAGVVYRIWWLSDVEQTTDSLAAHVQALSFLQPGVDYALPSFPAPERMDEVPTFNVRLNRFEIREREFTDKPAPGVRRIIATGASPTFGNGVEYDDRFTALLEGALDARHPGSCEVLNAGKLGLSTPTAVRLVREMIAPWEPSVLIYSTMSNDIRHPSDTLRFHITPQKLLDYERHLRELVQWCRERNIAVVFWANTTARADFDPLEKHRQIMLGVAREEPGAWAVDLLALYEEHPATAEEQREFLASRPWTSFYDDPSGGLPIERTALHVDWVHPNKFGNARLADGLLPLVEEALGFVEDSEPDAAPQAVAPTEEAPQPEGTIRLRSAWRLPFVSTMQLFVVEAPTTPDEAGGLYPPFATSRVLQTFEIDASTWPVDLRWTPPEGKDLLFVLDLDQTRTVSSGDPSSAPWPAGADAPTVVIDRALPDRPGAPPQQASPATPPPPQ